MVAAALWLSDLRACPITTSALSVSNIIHLVILAVFIVSHVIILTATK